MALDVLLWNRNRVAIEFSLNKLLRSEFIECDEKI